MNHSWVAPNPGATGGPSTSSPHVATGLTPSPVDPARRLRRREDVAWPPALTTSGSGLQHHGVGGPGLGAGYSASPTTSLSSPFSQTLTPYSPSPGGVMNSSPMASRLSSSSYGAPYNPQQWGPVSGGSSPQVGQVGYSQASSGGRLAQVPPPPRASDSLPSPPPPYSPRNPPQSSQRGNINTTASASEGASLAVPSAQPGGVPDNAVSLSSEGPSMGWRHSMPRSRPVSMVSLSDGHANWQSAYLPPPPPPPPPGGTGIRSSSRGTTEPHLGPFDAGPSGTRPVIPSALHRQSSPYDQHVSIYQDDIPTHAPSSKRAASTGALQSDSSSRATSTSHSRSPPRRSWEPGMPLPPPPPGPPPAPRSQSATGSSDTSSKRIAHAPTSSRSRNFAMLGTTLDRIPQTPAGWVDEESSQGQPKSARRPLHIDTSSLSGSHHPETQSQLVEGSSSSVQRPNSGGLFRSLAIRDASAKGIRERRIESRQRRHPVSEDWSAVSASSNPWADALEQVTPSDLILSPADETSHSTSSRQQAIHKHPLSARSTASDDPLDTTRSRTSSGLFSNRSSFSTPKPENHAVIHRREITQTPPFSPGGEGRSSAFNKDPMHGVPLKTLPTPPPNSAQESKPPARLGVKTEDHTVSHVPHPPFDGVSVPAPLSPRRIPSRQDSSLDSIVQKANSFGGSLQRYHSFAEKEAAAASDAEALKLFADFMIAESHIRRQLYSKAFESGALNVDEVRKNLFSPINERQNQPSRVNVDTTHQPPRSAGENKGSGAPSRPESSWWNNYQPCLSPIASISIDNDEMSSRGRAPSRWWESKTGSSSEGGERKMQRSKRESKYMGVPRELREAMQMNYHETLLEADEDKPGTPNQPPASYGPNEYPPEKTGWHEPESQIETQPSMMTLPGARDMAVEEPKMDISRLVTLPPPYPRHHPAVNNSHPDLVVYRTTVRSISDLSEIKATRQHNKLHIEQLRKEHQTKIRGTRQQFKSNLQQQIQQGSITFAEAAEAEAALGLDEQQMERELVQLEFDSYQEMVLKPMYAILSDRMKKATGCIDELSGKLNDAAGSPDQTQEEGDEKPELLEKLTQLKWLFEAREQLHRETYELLGESNEKYQAVVSLSYKQGKNEEKVRETEAFFSKDAFSRRVQYEADALARLESFMDVVEESVKCGVETHLSAFWDIAPSLVTLVQQIPENLHGFQIQIPAREYEENPSYHQSPLQYLYSLLLHAEKSTYQFIESQTNLLCLLHEVKSGVMYTNFRLMEAQRVRHGEREDIVRREMQESRAREERELTADLKDRVATVEGQWTEALGSQIQGLRQRVISSLVAEGSWDDMEQLV